MDLLTVAGHKMYAPKGVGALYVWPGMTIEPMVFGGGQEGGLRPGTENVPYIVGLGKAAELALTDIAQEAESQVEIRRLMEAALTDLWDPGVVVYGKSAPRLPNTVYCGFRKLNAGDILSGLMARDVAVSGGAACHGDGTDISYVLEAMGAPLDVAPGTIRFSWGRSTSTMMALDLLKRLGDVLDELGGEG
ncbi:MAG: aminotransferase class V-fold PLP-dependent enzyme [Desulfovibrio sp.]|nr:MAG: aminotransferase class V-fold PLP-dependent enzyme [Desulfovibrio sp.]